MCVAFLKIFWMLKVEKITFCLSSRTSRFTIRQLPKDGYIFCCSGSNLKIIDYQKIINEPRREETNVLHKRKQRPNSAAR